VPKNLVTARLFEEIAWRLEERGIKGWEEVDGGGEAETLQQQVMNNSAAVQQVR
jgi:hypothetical protein